MKINNLNKEWMLVVCLMMGPILSGKLYSQTQESPGHLVNSVALIENALQAGEIGQETALVFKIWAIYKPNELPDKFRNVNDTEVAKLKCGTSIIDEIVKQWATLSKDTQNLLLPYLQPPQLQKTYNTPPGNFTLHYDTSGTHMIPLADANGNKIPDYVENFGAYFENVWNYEIATLGYIKPVFTDPKYQIYIIDMASYGVTHLFIDSSTRKATNSYIEVENDYIGPSFGNNSDPEGKQKGAMKVTAAHEFFHAIQGSYDVLEESWWKETTSTWMEDQVYNQVNDYVNYLQEWFDSPELSLDDLTKSHEYGSVIYAKYLTEHTGGAQQIKDIWIRCETQSSLDAIETELGSDDIFRTVFKLFTAANYILTNTNVTPPTPAYNEGSLYPAIKIANTYNNSAGQNDHFVQNYSLSSVGVKISDGAFPQVAIDNVNHLASSYVSFKKPAQLDKNTQIWIWFNGDGISGNDWGAMLVTIDKNGHRTRDAITLDSFNNGLKTFSNFGDDLREIIFIPSNVEKNDDGQDAEYAIAVLPQFQNAYTPVAASGTTATVKNYDQDNSYINEETISVEVDLSTKVHVGSASPIPVSARTLSVDFSAVDSNYQPGAELITAVDATNHRYKIEYKISASNTILGDNLAIHIKAQDLSKMDDAIFNLDASFKVNIRPPSASVALILDRSGSMTGAPLANAKSAANQGITTMKIDDEVAVVSFNHTASVDYALTKISNDGIRQAARGKVNGLAAGGNTSIGAGLVAGYNQLVVSKSKKRNYILLSDGMENTAPYVADVIHLFKNLNPNPIIKPYTLQRIDSVTHHIHTIAFGAQADQKQMSEIANLTGGIFLFTPTQNNPLALSKVFNAIQNEISGEQTLASIEDSIRVSQVNSHPFTISQGNLQETITLLWDKPADVLLLELNLPDGRTITSSNWQTFAGVSQVAGPGIQYFTINNPQAGAWTARAIANAVSGLSKYALVFTAQSSIKMAVAFDKSEYSAGEPIVVSAKLEESGQPILGATVTADVTLPTSSTHLYQLAQSRNRFLNEENPFEVLPNFSSLNGREANNETLRFVTAPITLFDDGLHGDGTANDGVYANAFTNTTKDGTYTFAVQAAGTTSQGGAFTRQTTFSTFVKPSTAPAIAGINPDHGQAGQTLDITLTGANFINSATVSFSGSGITINSTNFVNATELGMNISIAANTQPGPRDVIVRNPNGQSATSAGLFNVIGCGPAAATFADNFESGTDNWLALTPTNWGINLIGSDQVFCLSVPNAVRDEYVIQRGEPWLDFDLTLEAKSDAPSNKNFFIVFGTTDFRSATNNGYYLQFALGAVKLYRSTGGARGVEIASATRDYVSDNLFHRIRLERKQPNVKVTVDGLAVINVNDGAFAIGSIGFGSFNSQACFDDVQITGWRADPSYYSDGFYDGNADGWSPLTPSRWQVGSESGSLRYFINTTNYEPVNSARLGELSLLANKTLNDFVFECHAKSADAAARNENADLALVFGYQDFDSYYYVNFNSAPGLTQLFRTHNGVNTVLATFNQSTFTEGDTAYHALRLERTGSQILAFFDGRQVLAATDNFFGAGQVGIGSYNDAGYFDNFALTGECSTPTTKIPVAFQVNLTVQICENKFAPATDQLSVRGSFNGFVDGVDVLTDPDGNGIYTTSVELDASMAGATIDYKYSFLHAGQTVVENLPNRQFIIPGGGGTVPLVFFDNDDQCNRNVPIFPTAASPQTAGSEFVVDVNIGDNTNPASNLFGVSFELNYTNTALIDVVTPASANVTPGPFLGNDVIFVSNVDESAGKVSIGVSRKASQGGVNGNGVVAHIKFRSFASTPNGTTVTFDLRNVTANDPPGNTIALTAAATTITIASGIIVWPGDANNDKAVNQADVLPLGVYWTQTGPKRANASSAWIGQPATAWSPIAATYADANGDGVVNQADVLPIGVNFGRTHTALYPFAEKGDESTTLSKTNAATISTTFIGNTNPGQDFDLDVVVNDVTGLFGVSFELVYSPVTLLDPQATSAGSFMGTDPIFFANTDKATGKISAGVSRKAGQTSVTGAGVVAKIKMRVSSQAVRGQAITFTLQNVTANDANGQAMTLSVSPGPPLLVSVVSRRLAALPTVFALHQNSPNPFNPSTEISYDLPEASDVQVAVFDMLGKHVRTLVNERQVVGSYSIFWDGRDEYGQLVASGVFIAHLRAGKFVQSRKMLLVR